MAEPEKKITLVFTADSVQITQDAHKLLLTYKQARSLARTLLLKFGDED